MTRLATRSAEWCQRQSSSVEPRAEPRGPSSRSAGRPAGAIEDEEAREKLSARGRLRLRLGGVESVPSSPPGAKGHVRDSRIGGASANFWLRNPPSNLGPGGGGRGGRVARYVRVGGNKESVAQARHTTLTDPRRTHGG
eukprot:scaffold23224_cov31-Tisochrysis_lutea.AAC.2